MLEKGELILEKQVFVACERVLEERTRLQADEAFTDRRATLEAMLT